MKRIYYTTALTLWFVIVIACGVYVASHTLSFGTFNFVSSGIYTLSGGGIGSSDTSITIDNFVKPVSETHYVMATDFGSIGYLTLEPGSQTNKEFISFTGIVYSGTRATISGVIRGLEFNYPYTSSSTLQLPHSGGTKVIVSNPPQLYDQLVAKANSATISGLYTYSSTSIPKLDQNPNTAGWGLIATTSFATVGYVNDTNNTGAANASEVVAGLSELATNAEAGAGTSVGGTGARLTLPASIATSTPTVAGCSTFCVVVAASGKIAQAFLDLTQHFSFSSLFATNASSTNATTTGSVYFPFVTSSLLKTSSAGKVAAATYGVDYAPQRITIATTSAITISNGGQGSTTAYTIAAGTITASSTIEITTSGNCTESGGAGTTCTWSLRTSTGTTLIDCANPYDITTSASTMRVKYTILFNQSVSSQKIFCEFYQSSALASNGISNGNGTASINFANAVGLQVTVTAGSFIVGSLSDMYMIVHP